ncbi:MAG: hypothetical protein CL957_02245, partial [Euryarchaeota archaeon]|nr:hypothetical protein [Euryarchaeota archaeon]
ALDAARRRHAQMRYALHLSWPLESYRALRFPEIHRTPRIWNLKDVFRVPRETPRKRPETDFQHENHPS